jgi:DNA primase
VQFGVENVVATLGTAMTNDNLKRLTRLTDRVVFCFDGDRAGRAAAWRAMETALPYGGGTVELKFLLLPEKDDPDTFVRSQGADEFRKLTAAALPLSDFLVKELATRVDFGTVDGRSRFEAIAKPLLKRLPEGTYRAAVMDAFGATLHLAPTVLDQMMSDRPTASTPNPAPAGSKRRTLVQKVINLALHYPEAAAKAVAADTLVALNQPGADLLRRVLATAQRLPNANTARLLENLREDPDVAYLERIVAEPPLDSEEAALGVLEDALDRMAKEARKSETLVAIRAYKPGGQPH